MASTAPRALSGGIGADLLRTAWPIWLGLALLYVPTYLMAARTLWPSAEHAHGPLVLAVALWVAWRERGVILAGTAVPRPFAGWALLLPGLAAYALGRSQDVALLEIASQIPVLAGVLLATRGTRALRGAWFALLFLVFLVPLPGFVVDAVTGSLKQHVSALAEMLLHASGYPVARSGVVLMLGPYQMLVADACSGLNSMFSLAAVGLFYVYLTGVRPLWRSALLLATVPAIAFAANVARVLALALITYHLGDAAGQGFLHDFASFTLFAAALVLLVAWDTALRGAGALAGRRA